MTRSILVTEIFIKATGARFGAGDESAALTLMSTDMERISNGFRSLHNIWASFLQAALAAWMLYNRLGVAFVVPLAVVLVCFIGLGILMRITGDSQRGWMAAVQKRVGLTATAIASMKNLKIGGLATAVGEFIQKLRVEELAAGARFRVILIIAAVFAYIPLLLSPPLTFAATQRTLDVSTMFTSLSYLLLLTEPLSQIFQAIPQLLAGLACLGRIQAYLECETRHDYRQVLANLRLDSEKDAAKKEDSSILPPDSTNPAVVEVQNGRFSWTEDGFALQDVNIRVAKSSLTVIVGPVGSGKSTLCKALLGEVPFSGGSVVFGSIHPHVGFCDQTAFLSNASIRDNIVGFSPFNEERYAEVIEATALSMDLVNLPRGDRTNVGSNGITLSGGQKQRVSLARALYLQSDLLVLDDIFSGLDADTEEQVFRQVFGPDGLLRRRRASVLLSTHSIKHLPLADHIIALADGAVIEQGSFAKLTAGQGYVQRLGLSSISDSDGSSGKSTPTKSVPESGSRCLQPTMTNTSVLAPRPDESRRAGDRRVYTHYFKSMGWVLTVSSLVFGALWGFFTNFPTICKSVGCLTYNTTLCEGANFCKITLRRVV